METTQATRESDPRNLAILADREREYNAIPGPRVGDFLKLPSGAYTRFTYDWGDTLQTGGSSHGGYYLSDGSVSYSGGLDPGIKRADLLETPEFKPGWFWFFDHNYPRAHGGVDFPVSCRVFVPREGADLSGLWTK